MSPLKRGKKKEKKKEVELAEKVEEKAEETSRKVEPITWFSELTNLGDVRSDLALLPDVDIQFQVSNSLVRFLKKGLEKPVLSEDRSLRPDAMIMISDKAWRELVKTQGLDEFVNVYRKYSRNPTPEEFIKVNVNQQKLLSDRGILRSKLFKALLLS
jgi:hypothetical protein